LNETLLTFLFVGLVFIISIFIVMNYFHSTQNRPKKRATGTIDGLILTTDGKDPENILVQVGKVRTDEKFSYRPLMDKNGRTYESYTDHKGEFEINNIPIGKHWIIVRKNGYKTMLKMVTVCEDKNTKVDDIVLS